MTIAIAFRNYCTADEHHCLAIFDENCPKYFAKNEREDYVSFLKSKPKGYQVCLRNDVIVGAFGLLAHGENNNVSHAINWILISPSVQGGGVGKHMMQEAMRVAIEQKIDSISIAASHLSAPFFVKFGAQVIKETPNGWGKDMHRVDMMWQVRNSI